MEIMQKEKKGEEKERGVRGEKWKRIVMSMFAL